jgi:hypothetical protein
LSSVKVSALSVEPLFIISCNYRRISKAFNWTVMSLVINCEQLIFNSHCLTYFNCITKIIDVPFDCSNSNRIIALMLNITSYLVPTGTIICCDGISTTTAAPKMLQHCLRLCSPQLWLPVLVSNYIYSSCYKRFIIQIIFNTISRYVLTNNIYINRSWNQNRWCNILVKLSKAV